MRLRAGLVEKLIKQLDPDIICLQETKCPNDQFPEKVFHKHGFTHIVKNGLKGYHGVATLSRHPFHATHIIDYCKKQDGRHIETAFLTQQGMLRVHNFYVPAGGDEPDPDINEKFAHKLAFLAEMKRRFSPTKQQGNDKMVLLGDLNIAPYEHDVWSSRQLQKVVSHTPVERARLEAVRKTLDWEDVARRFIPESEKLYSWWSYRARDWAASNRGRRLDHIWATPALSGHISHYDILRAARGWEKPSDHVPVFIDIELNFAE